MRARYPDQEGYVERKGVKTHYELFGQGEPTILLVPSSPIVHSQQWKAQVPYLARHFRVLTFDGRGNGRSDRPGTSEAYGDEEIIADMLAVMDTTGTKQAVLVALCPLSGGLPFSAARSLAGLCPAANAPPARPGAGHPQPCKSI